MSAEAPIELLESSDDESPQIQSQTRQKRKGTGESKWARRLNLVNQQRQQKKRPINATNAAAASSDARLPPSLLLSRPKESPQKEDGLESSASVPKRLKKRAVLETVAIAPPLPVDCIKEPAAASITAAASAASEVTTTSATTTRTSMLVTATQDMEKSIEEPTASPDKPPRVASATKDTRSIVDVDVDDLLEDDDDEVIQSLIQRSTTFKLQTDPPKSLMYMKHHCWACHEWIEHPTTLEQTAVPDKYTNEKTYCCYLLHDHPVLDVPVCVVCAEKMEDLLLPSPSASPTHSGNDDTQEVTSAADAAAPAGDGERPLNDIGPDNHFCSACGQQDSEDFNPTWFFCDNACGRVFCHHCIAQANGSVKEVEALIDSDDPNKKWFCCACAPPDFLKQLQDYTHRLHQEAEAMTSSTETSSFQASQEGLDDLIAYLQLVEDKKEECDERLDNIGEDMEEIRRDCERDEDLTALSPEELQEHIEQSQVDCRDAFEHQRLRLVDTIATIEDILSSVYGIESRRVYKAIQGSENIAGIQKAVDDDPEWKRAADKANAKREKEYIKGKGKKVDDYDPDDARYRMDYDDDIEDLGEHDPSDLDDFKPGSDSEDSYEEYRAGWRQSQYLASQEAINTAMEEEEKRYRKRNIHASPCNRQEEKRDRRNWNRSLKPFRRKRNGSGKTLIKQSKTSLQKSSTSGQSEDKQDDASTDAPDSSDDEIQCSKASSSSFQLSLNPQIAIANHFDEKLKKHQREGIKFMFKSSFADLGDNGQAEIGGCILAHSMGLGKSLSVITLLHTLMFLPQSPIRKILLVIPVNTVANWENEFSKWTEGLKDKINLHNPGEGQGKPFRMKILKSWTKIGGVLLISDALFRTSMKTQAMNELLIKPDAIFLDESHTMLKNTENQTFKELTKVDTKRRVCLTGTPFQNNLLEYYRMVSYIRPGLLGDSEKKFEREYAEPIYDAMASDAGRKLKEYADDLIQVLTSKVDPFVHRRDATVLVRDLPSLQQVVLHVRPTKEQRALYALYRKYQRKSGQNNFFHQFSSLRPINNHPATILYRPTESTSGKPQESSGNNNGVHQIAPINKGSFNRASLLKTEVDATSATTSLQQNMKQPPQELTTSCAKEIIDLMDDSEDEKENLDEMIDEDWIDNGHWSATFVNKMGSDLKAVTNGNKCVMLLHILMHADQLGEKTLVFSQCLRTLDYLSEILSEKDWTKLVPSLTESFPGKRIGGWRRGVDFLRIDGSTGGVERGELIKDFTADGNIKLFLISSLAGSLGITLTSASRCVLFDSHFNPTVDLQAIFRTYRYGQTRPVFCYRFLTQGSMEEKVYSRAVTKTGLAGRVIDKKTLERVYNKDELDSLAKVDDWVECDRCKRWRMVPPDAGVDVLKLSDNWYCEMMEEHDHRVKWTCRVPEKDAVWYNTHFKKPNISKAEMKGGIYMSPSLSVGAGTKMNDDAAKKLVERDLILKNILTISADGVKEVVSKYYFHDALLTEKDARILKEGKKDPPSTNDGASKSKDDNDTDVFVLGAQQDQEGKPKYDPESAQKRARLSFSQ